MKIPQRYVNARIQDVPELKGIGIDDSFFFTGGVGSGKTYAVYALANERNKQSKRGVIIPYDTLLTRVKATWGGGKWVSVQGDPNGGYYEDEESIVDWLSFVPWLVIDDIGNSSDELIKQNPFAVSVIFQILNNRNMNEMQIGFTSNGKPGSIERQFNDKIISRIIGMCRVVEFKHADRRIK